MTGSQEAATATAADEATDAAPTAIDATRGDPAASCGLPAARAVVIAASAYGSAAYWHGHSRGGASREVVAAMQNDRRARWADFVDALDQLTDPRGGSA